jgi:hypothetical protein
MRRKLVITGFAAGTVTVTALLIGQHLRSAVSTQPPTQTAPLASVGASLPVVTGQHRAAENLSAFLAQSTHSRAAVTYAVNDVNRCGPNLRQDQQTFRNAATEDRYLLKQLTGLPHRSALPLALLTNLTQAWQAELAADQDFARWAYDEIQEGCRPADTADQSYLAAIVPVDDSTTYMQAFTKLWKPIAMRYGLTIYQPGQL